MATQTTEDDVLNQESFYNGIRIITAEKRPPPHQYQQRHHQHQSAARNGPSASAPELRPSVPPPTEVATSLLKAVRSPWSSATSAPSHVASTGRPPALRHQSDYHQDDRHQTTGTGTGTGSRWDNADHSRSTRPIEPTLASADNVSTTQWFDSTPSTTGPRALSSNNEPKRQSEQKAPATVDPWETGVTPASPATNGGFGAKRQPEQKDPPAADPWGTRTTPTATGAGGEGGFGGAGWNDTTQVKGAGALVDWSSGLVTEFPADVKPTKMTVVQKWDPDQERDLFAQRKSGPVKGDWGKPPSSQQGSSAQQAPSRHDENTNEDRYAAKPDDLWMGGGSNMGNMGNIGFANRAGASSTGGDSSSHAAFEERRPSDTHSTWSRDQDNRGRNQTRNPSAQDNNEPRSPSSLGASSQERRPMTSEERFNNSLNRQAGYQNDYNSQGSGSGTGYGSRSYGNDGSDNGGNQSYNVRDRSRGSSGGQYGASDNDSNRGSQPSRGGTAPQRPSEPPLQNQRNGPTSVNLAGRRTYGSNNPDHDVAMAAWATASQSALRHGGVHERSASRASTTTPTSPQLPAGNRPVLAGSGGGGLATTSDFKSFLQAAKAFTPSVKSKASKGDRTGRSGSVSGSIGGSRQSSPGRTRHTEEQQYEHDHQQQQQQQQQEHRQIQDVPETEREGEQEGPEKKEDSTTMPDVGTDWSVQVEEEELERNHAKTKSPQQSPPVSGGNSSNGSSKGGMEDNLLLFQDHQADVDQGDAGQGDAGQGDADQGDAGQGDAGQGDAGQGDAGQGGAGQGDADQGDSGQGDAPVETTDGQSGDDEASHARNKDQPESSMPSPEEQQQQHPGSRSSPSNETTILKSEEMDQ
ncbi:hypothetical protein BGZ54_000880 [Gamsiella multidivaricata]|nr:hypothetical protein BGZ54_000880 [Gamsiella multidivaricata]